MPIYTQSVTPSDSISTAASRFEDEVITWIRVCMDRYADAPATAVHDQGTYTTAWEPIVRRTGDAEILAFLKTARDRMRDHYVSTGLWRHGYWRMQEAHHGTEHYELFLGMLLRLDPADAETRRQLIDAAEHMGNWSATAPPWFNDRTNRFHSFFFGTDAVQTNPGDDFNRTDHLRCVNICLLAYDASADRRYLDFAVRYAGAWADAIVDAPRLPIGLTPHGALYHMADAPEAVYRKFVGEASQPLTDIDRAENFLASDGVNTFLRLWHETGDVRFRRAAERLLDPLITQITDPDAGVVAAAVRDYRRWTADPRYDAAVLHVLESDPIRPVQTLSLDTDARPNGRPVGVGKRSDMLHWLEDGAPRRHHPVTLAVAAEIGESEDVAVHALDLARATFVLARNHLPDGRDHGCAARTVSAVARGHGRENHAGVVTSVLGSMMMKMMR
ncbi:hypothetical protein GC175_25375 [bacterium]|nr:hypothetical protein [bacterium]